MDRTKEEITEKVNFYVHPNWTDVVDKNSKLAQYCPSVPYCRTVRRGGDIKGLLIETPWCREVLAPRSVVPLIDAENAHMRMDINQENPRVFLQMFQ